MLPAPFILVTALESCSIAFFILDTLKSGGIFYEICPSDKILGHL